MAEAIPRLRLKAKRIRTRLLSPDWIASNSTAATKVTSILFVRRASWCNRRAHKAVRRWFSPFISLRKNHQNVRGCFCVIVDVVTPDFPCKSGPETFPQSARDFVARMLQQALASSSKRLLFMATACNQRSDKALKKKGSILSR
ncbi:MAG: hypothetical protein JNK47_03980 [Mesorhizobium sp.]|nr:hypothetical protein [Mesorhizobium sp.]MBL8576361.1 hypothetical protein [Mesorhizobium sp.]